VLSYGGIVGLGDKLFALPHKMVRHSEGENRMTLALDENVLKNAPGFDQSKWPTEANADYYQKLDAYYKEHDERRAEAAKDRIDEEADRARDRIDETARAAGERLEQSADQKADELERTGEKVAEGVKEESKKASDRMADAADDARLTTEHDVTAQPAAAQIGGEEKLTWNRRVSSLIGANVENSQGENLGEVHDLVLDWDKGEVRYAVLSYGGILGIGDKLFAVPIDAFSHQQDSSKLVLDVSKEQLKSAPGFNKDQWPNMADPQWSNQVKEFYQQDRPGREQAD